MRLCLKSFYRTATEVDVLENLSVGLQGVPDLQVLALSDREDESSAAGEIEGFDRVEALAVLQRVEAFADPDVEDPDDRELPDFRVVARNRESLHEAWDELDAGDGRLCSQERADFRILQSDVPDFGRHVCSSREEDVAVSSADVQRVDVAHVAL